MKALLIVIEGSSFEVWLVREGLSSSQEFLNFMD